MSISRTAATAVIVTLTAIAPVTAFAADLSGGEDTPTPPYEEKSSGGWSGLYFGATGDYAFRRGTTDAPAAANVNGLGFGGFAGAQMQSGRMVYGAEADAGLDGAHGPIGTTTLNRGLEGSLRARLGYAVSDDLLIYGTGGGAARNVSITDAGGSDNGIALGWTAGAGLDVKAIGNTFVRGEYRYTGFGDKTLDTGSGAQSIGLSGSTVRLGLGVKF
ncbi:MAG: outer membrane beta-barrel protein [Rhizobiaceae bacterium]